MEIKVNMHLFSPVKTHPLPAVYQILWTSTYLQSFPISLPHHKPASLKSIFLKHLLFLDPTDIFWFVYLVLK